MPEQPILTAKEAETLLLNVGFAWIRSKGSHKVYRKNGRLVVIPFHGTKSLHPKITKQVLTAISQ